MRSTMQNFSQSARHVSKRLIFSYALDWVLIIATAGIGAAFYKINGNRHVFSLDDASISFPYLANETVTTTTLALVSLVAPAILTFLIALVFPPRPTTTNNKSSNIWRLRLYTWNKSWLGLAFALAGAFFVTNGLKDLTGKPRPDLLARCLPDVANARQFAVGGLGFQFGEAPVLVDWHVCTQTDSEILSDGFASFPSGHSSFSWAGLGYLSLFVWARFGGSVPGLKLNKNNKSAAAPSYYQLAIAFVPVGTAFFVASSRWSDYRHHGFDIIFGSLLGAAFAWLGFWWYHLPVKGDAVWASGADLKSENDLEAQPERRPLEAGGLGDVDGAASPVQRQEIRQV